MMMIACRHDSRINNRQILWNDSIATEHHRDLNQTVATDSALAMTSAQYGAVASVQLGRRQGLAALALSASSICGRVPRVGTR